MITPTRSSGSVIVGANGKVFRCFAENWGALNFGKADNVPVTCEKDLRELARHTRQTRDGKALERFCYEQIEKGDSYPGINHILQQEGLCLVSSVIETFARNFVSFDLRQIIRDDEGIYSDSISCPIIQQNDSSVEFYAMGRK